MKRLNCKLVFAIAGILPVALQLSTLPVQADSKQVQSYNEQAKLHPLGENHDLGEPLEIVKGSKANLTILKDGAYVWLATQQLTPRNVYTLWFAVINKPENCKATPCNVKDFVNNADMTVPDVGYADGLIAGADGTGKFSAFIPAGKLKQNWFGNGYNNLKTGEVHLVVHDHGPLIPERAAEMLSTYRDGCTTESLFKTFPEISKSDGKPGPNECNLLQIVLFLLHDSQ